MKIIEWLDGLLPALFNKIENPLLDNVMVFLTRLGDAGFIWITVSVVMLIVHKQWGGKRCFRAGLSSLLSLGTCAYFGNVVLKPIFARVRPCNLYDEIELLINRPTDFSFPSMHTATSFSVAVILYRYDKRVGAPALVLATLISLSRVYLRVHYTTDIIAGAILGCAFALLFYYLFFKFRRKDNNA